MMEHHILRTLQRGGYTFRDNTESKTLPDFHVRLAGQWLALEVKEKVSRYNLSNWPTDIPEEDLFILDELSVKKMLAHGINSMLAVWTNNAYSVYTLLDLVAIPKARVNRQQLDNYTKGKWLFRLSHAAIRNLTADGVLASAERFMAKQKDLLFASSCYRPYIDDVPDGGIPRTHAHMAHDFATTRPGAYHA